MAIIRYASDTSPSHILSMFVSEVATTRLALLHLWSIVCAKSLGNCRKRLDISLRKLFNIETLTFAHRPQYVVRSLEKPRWLRRSILSRIRPFIASHQPDATLTSTSTKPIYDYVQHPTHLRPTIHLRSKILSRNSRQAIRVYKHPASSSRPLNQGLDFNTAVGRAVFIFQLRRRHYSHTREPEPFHLAISLCSLGPLLRNSRSLRQ